MADRKQPRRKRVTGPFSKNFSTILAERRLSQKQAADLMGIAVSVVHDWINGSYPHDPAALLKFCQAIKCDFQWLLTGHHSRPVTSTNLAEVFDVQPDPDFSGIFMIEAKRLKIKKATGE